MADDKTLVEKMEDKTKMEDVKPVEAETVVEETKMEEVKETKIDAKKVEKDIAIANAYSLRISPKASYAVCKVIKNKSPERAIKRLDEAAAGKRAIPMAGREVPHQKGKGLSGGRFPKNACNEIKEIIKQVSANATVAGIENPIITIAHANRGSAPFRKGGRRGKRTHLHLEVRDKSKLAGRLI